jgi:hypothetical protein
MRIGASKLMAPAFSKPVCPSYCAAPLDPGVSICSQELKLSPNVTIYFQKIHFESKQ